MLVVLFAGIAVSVFVPAATRPVILAAIVTAPVIWVVGEKFGGILTGSGTHPKMGPLLVLIALGFWPVSGLISTRQRRGEYRSLGRTGGTQEPVQTTASKP